MNFLSRFLWKIELFTVIKGENNGQRKVLAASLVLFTKDLIFVSKVAKIGYLLKIVKLF